jgi:[glutamine synthetase] adenylyltransferase / [glutamine synthetase]-adenylyl-L-tyrosine phosphorylase
MPDQELQNLEGFIDTLPDPAGARVFFSRLQSADPALLKKWKNNPLLMSRLLTLAGHSPFLAETLLRHPEHISWLQLETERGLDRMKSIEHLSEELARFVTRAIDADESTKLTRFKRRELLRIYLRDCLGIATLSEITEELSNLADVILSYALAQAHQQMVNRHGHPLTRDERGRIETAEFAIAALGKLGCRELNYASDIDLLFLFSGNGTTAGDRRSADSTISNKEFFTAVADRVVQLIGRSSPEGAVYRIDLRLRPYGRDGEMVCEIGRAIEYYRKLADNWERQALIRARASAGNGLVVSNFLNSVRDAIFSRDALPDTIEDVRRAKENIDRKEAARRRGYNVKLGPGGIREIEFIAQALQLKHGGREPWVRSAQTLIVLARLAEKQYLTENERSRLSEAYTFLRTAEHRLQMEHGAQTHTLPLSEKRLELLARRCGYVQSSSPAGHFIKDLEKHTTAVRSVYERVFAQSSRQQLTAEAAVQEEQVDEVEDQSRRLIKQTAAKLKTVFASDKDEHRLFTEPEKIEQVLASALPHTINPSRALRHLMAFTDSLATYTREHAAEGLPDDVTGWTTLIERLIVVLSSQYLSHLLVSRPLLAGALLEDHSPRTSEEFIHILREAVAREGNPAAKTDALRRAWYCRVIAIGYQDMKWGGHNAGSKISSPIATLNLHEANRSDLSVGGERHSPDQTEPLKTSNLTQTALAEATLTVASEIAMESSGVRDVPPSSLPVALLGLGRLGHTGMDFGSDLDLLIVFDDERPWPPSFLSHLSSSGAESNAYAGQEFYANFTAQIIRVLSSITREGLLYRIDLRLRPEGKSGPIAVGLGGLIAYLKNRASAWEHSAYLKAREVAGDPEFGKRVCKIIYDVSLEAASQNEFLRDELREMRERQVKEKTRGEGFNIKLGRGGMSDVYFITRYLQLRDRIYFPAQRGTTALIEHLGERGSLDGESTDALFYGYQFLRRLDHWLRLLMDHPSPVIPSSTVALQDISSAMGIDLLEEFDRQLAHHTASIRAAFDRVFA